MKTPRHGKGEIDDYFSPVKHDLQIMTKSVLCLDWDAARYLYITIHQSMEALSNTTDLYIDHIPVEDTHTDDIVNKHINKMLCRDLRCILDKLETIFPSLKEVWQDDAGTETKTGAETP